MKLNTQGKVIFSPDWAHMYAQVQNIGITNTTGQTIDLYLNGQFIEHMLPGGWVGSGFNYPGKDIYTIPNTNPNTQLTVTVRPHIVPNTNLEINTYGRTVFSPHWLKCLFNEGPCFSITNTTSKAINIYLNGTFMATIYPNQVYGAGLSSPGTYIFTMPDDNPNAKLTVVGK